MAAFYMNTNNQVDQVAYWWDSYPDASTLPGGMMMCINPNSIPDSKPHALIQHEIAMFPHFASDESGSVLGCKFLKPAQQLLNEAVNVKLHANHGRNRCNDREASFAGRHDLQSTIMKLCAMLDELERRYRDYSREMSSVSTSFDDVAGSGSGKQYTALASQVISRRFRTLRDAITGQIAAARRRTGQEDSVDVVIPRLRHVDRRFMQRKMGGKQQQSWRPQRGLPESSVSILRAWLFEHFLHPYPRDSDKVILAKQAGLTRGQVSNWFINARVRLWKPMVEEMYKGESGEGETECTRSFEREDSKQREVTEKERENDGLHVSGGSRHEVSLTLGLQHWDEGVGFECMNQGNKQPNGFSIDHFVHDLVTHKDSNYV